MTPQTVMFFVAGFLFIAIFYGLWQTLCVDWARQEMFEARNALFKLAEEGKWSFETEAYRNVRLHIELMIRFAHCISWPRLVLYRFLAPLAPRKDLPDFKKLIGSIDNEDVRREVEEQLTKVVIAVVKLALWRSAILILFTAVVIIGYRCYEPMRGRLKKAGWHAYTLVQADAITMEAVQ